MVHVAGRNRAGRRSAAFGRVARLQPLVPANRSPVNRPPASKGSRPGYIRRFGPVARRPGRAAKGGRGNGIDGRDDEHARHQGLLQSVMPDVQGSADARQLPIQRVGVKAVALSDPLALQRPGGTGRRARPGQPAGQPRGRAAGRRHLQPVRVAAGRAEGHAHVALHRPARGSQQPRAKRRSTTVAVKALHGEMLQRLEADSGRIEMSFTLFVRKTAPVSRRAEPARLRDRRHRRRRRAKTRC